jgi:hypothetical protein
MKPLLSSLLDDRRRRVCALGVAALIALGAVASAQAGASTAHPAGAHAAAQVADVVFPTPGAMQFTGLPAQVRSGHHFTLREVMPLAIFGGVIHFQRETPSGGWTTLASAAVRPKVFWLHWFVRRALRGVQMQVRFVLESGGQLLAVSPGYAMSVTA